MDYWEWTGAGEGGIKETVYEATTETRQWPRPEWFLGRCWDAVRFWMHFVEWTDFTAGGDGGLLSFGPEHLEAWGFHYPRWREQGWSRMESRWGALCGACGVRDVHCTSKRRWQVGSQMVLTLTFRGTTLDAAISKCLNVHRWLPGGIAFLKIWRYWSK